MARVQQIAVERLLFRLAAELLILALLDVRVECVVAQNVLEADEPIAVEFLDVLFQLVVLRGVSQFDKLELFVKQLIVLLDLRRLANLRQRCTWLQVFLLLGFVGLVHLGDLLLVRVFLRINKAALQSAIKLHGPSFHIEVQKLALINADVFG